MNNRVSPTLIGAFVVGALALVVIAMVMFGSGQWFRKTKEFVLYFDSSVNGLRIGAPVKIRGVEIGAVKNILLRLDKDIQVPRIPVIIELDLKKFTSKGAAGTALTDPAAFKEAIDRGLRGQLQSESFVTGLLFIGLDFFPDSPANFVQNSESNSYPFQEIPTQPTTLQMAGDKASQIIAKLEEIDFKGLIESLMQAVNGINRIANSPYLKRALQSMDEVTNQLGAAAINIGQLATTVGSNVKIISDDMKLTSNDARAVIRQAGAAIKQTEATVKETEGMIKQTEAMFKEAELTMASMRAVTDPDSPTFYEITKTLKEVSAAARSLRMLTGYLERNPRALIFGKPETREE